MLAEDDAFGVVSDWLEAFNSLDWQAFEAALAPNITFTVPAQQTTLTGVQSVMSSYTSWRATFSGLQVKIVDGFACGNRIAAHMLWTGTSAAEHKPIRFPSCFLITVDGSKITTITDFYDQLTYEAQFEGPTG